MGELAKLPNIGKELEQQLNAAGINTVDELVDCGSEEAWLRIHAVDLNPCLNQLMAFEGAIQDVRWHYLSDEDKKSLKNFYENNK